MSRIADFKLQSLKGAVENPKNGFLHRTFYALESLEAFLTIMLIPTCVIVNYHTIMTIQSKAMRWSQITEEFKFTIKSLKSSNLQSNYWLVQIYNQITKGYLCNLIKSNSLYYTSKPQWC